MANAKEIVKRILENMDKRDRAQLGNVAFLVDDSPSIYPRRGTNAVVVSPAFIEFVDKFAQALAIEQLSPGCCFKSVCPQLSKNDGNQPFGAVPDAPAGMDAKALNNAHESIFGDIVAGTVAVEFAHMFLDQYGSHKKQLSAMPPGTPLKSFLTESEWQKAIRKGVMVPAKCGYGTDGLGSFYQSLESLSPRPAWVDYYMPRTAQAAKTRKLLDYIRDNSF